MLRVEHRTSACPGAWRSKVSTFDFQISLQDFLYNICMEANPDF